MRDRIKDILLESIQVKEEILRTSVGKIMEIAELVKESLRKNGKLIVFGNGGSASDSQHIAAELVGRFKKDRNALAAIALTTNTSILTALANDYGYEVVFAKQIEALGQKNDVAQHEEALRYAVDDLPHHARERNGHHYIGRAPGGDAAPGGAASSQDDRLKNNGGCDNRGGKVRNQEQQFDAREMLIQVGTLIPRPPLMLKAGRPASSRSRTE